MRHLIIGTAGHVDHGKTTLIRALTGTNTDRLAEEQARGMTIDLGFAFLSLPGELEAGIVDVPGHERFVKNMLAGAGGVDVALLVIAADEGPMPQTREHLDILTVLGVTVAVVALTKTDLADPDIQELAELETRELLAKTPLKDAVIVPVSAQTGAGLDALKQALAEAAAKAPQRDASAPVRLPVDRVFSLPGVGTVVTGTLVSGTLHAGDAVALEPQGQVSKARTLQSHSQKIETAEPGMRVAVNLPGIEVGELERGAVLCAPGSLAASTLLDARLSVLPSATKPLRHRERVRLHLGTGEILARLVLLEGVELLPGSDDIPVQLLCESPAAPARGERFVVRTYSPARAVGGGTIVDPTPSRKYRRGDAAALALFEARGTGAPDEAVYAQLSSKHAEFTAKELSAAVGFPADDALEALADAGRAIVIGGTHYLSDEAGRRLRETAKKTLEQFHRQNPYKRAMPRENLRIPLSKAATVKDFQALVAYLSNEGVLLTVGTKGVHLPEHEVVLPENWKQPAAHILSVFQAAQYAPPFPGDFAATYPRDVHVPTILAILCERDELVKIADNLYLSAEAIAEAKQAIRKLASTPEGITVGGLRDAIGSSRKIVLPLLEYLDGVRFTHRVGDTRTLAEP
ncbi:selenocysteine-specific translation elongation factor [Armatimonas rosea]|uniref:Selenocysteine-specific elongation factor n=1 Tax=Armatimonas rosea TaxID=685828 RepID=A0A7W9W6R4_ARMRO|nr:selenocysteine-specific translation elongation factor [Armatimonas rosea]MBB6051709.1 selenocysteine-specific elongation factor [Armatimonas rosea]